ncbi:hypothetical protein QYF36_014408 [Acer negundo]|nr:hypothetical protein QYF36_014408 [Acer negundo]
METPLVSVDVVVDLEGGLMWINCDNNVYNNYSSMYHPIRCGSSICNGQLIRPGTYCTTTNNTCGLSSYNPLNNTCSYDANQLIMFGLANGTQRVIGFARNLITIVG